MSKLRIRLCACIALLAVLLCGAALADETSRVVVWRVTAPDIDTEALREETFGTDISQVQAERRRNSSVFWFLDEEGIPFCGISHGHGAEGIQTRFDIYRHADVGEERTYYYNLDEWNVIPVESGFDTPRAEETLAEAQSLLARLGLVTENVAPEPVSFSTLGRMEGTAKCRKVVFVQTLEGLPIRWSAGSLYFLGEERSRVIVDPCYITVAYSDEDGLLMLEGNWCAFEPLTRASEYLRAEDALPLFRQAGFVRAADDPSALEACWFLSISGQEATATLAWRVGNTYLSAVDGTWLQTER